MKLTEKPVTISRTLAVIWAFIFVQFFRYSLDQLYPFWAHDISLSFFSFTILLFSIVSFSYFFYFHAKKKKKSTWFTIFAAINISLALIPLLIHGKENGIYFFPWLITPLILLQFFILSSKFSFFLSFRLEMVTGSLLGLIPIVFLQNPYLLFGFSYAIAIFPNRLLLQQQHISPKHVSRMESFRLIIDFLRFLFLGLTFYAIFDHFRQNFYVATIIILLATLLQFLILKFDHKKHHIKHGLFALATIFLFLGLGFNKIPTTFLWAFAYSVLVTWEALYFKKNAEGYLNREHLTMVIAAIVCTFFYFITYAWVLIIAVIIITIALIFLLYYIARPHRVLHSTFFLMAIFVWVFAGFHFFSHSLIRDFWQTNNRTLQTKTIIPINFLLEHSKKVESITTNLFPVKDVFLQNQDINSSKIIYKKTTPISLSFDLFLDRLNGQRPLQTRLIDLRKMRPFKSFDQKQRLFSYVSKYRFDNIYFFYVEKNNNTIYHPISDKKIILDMKTFNLNLELSQPIENIINQIINFHIRNGTLIQARTLQKYILGKNSFDYKKYLKLASINAGLKELKKQIENLEKAIALSPTNMLKEKKLLMELYYYSGDTTKSEYIAQALINQPKQSPFEYFRWMLKLYSEERDRYKLQQFYFKLKYYYPKSPQEELEKSTLLNEIHEALLANPSWFDIIDQEKKREEKLKYPD